MSYDICYDRCFIKSGLGYTPMWLVGSNNCTEWVWKGRKEYQRRERHWAPIDNMAGVSEADLMTMARKYVRGNSQHFEWHGKWVDDAGWLRFVENGIKKAVTIEEILRATHMNAMLCRLHVWVGDDSHFELETYVKSTEEYDDWLRKAKELKESRSDKWGPWYTIDMGLREPIKISYTSQNLTGRVAAKYEGNYIVRFDERSITYSKRVDDAIIFDNLDSAKKACEGRGLPISYVDGDSVAARKEWRWVVKVSTGACQGEYIRQRTARRLKLDYSAKYAKRFPTKAAAEKYIADLNNNGYKDRFEAEEAKE